MSLRFGHGGRRWLPVDQLQEAIDHVPPRLTRSIININSFAIPFRGGDFSIYGNTALIDQPLNSLRFTHLRKAARRRERISVRADAIDAMAGAINGTGNLLSRNQACRGQFHSRTGKVPGVAGFMNFRTDRIGWIEEKSLKKNPSDQAGGPKYGNLMALQSATGLAIAVIRGERRPANTPWPFGDEYGWESLL